MELVKDINYSHDTFINDVHDKKKKSLVLYKKYIGPVGLYLISKSRFKTGSPIIFYLISGIILDYIIYRFFSTSIVPLDTVLITLAGIIRESKKRKGKKMFAPYY